MFHFLHVVVDPLNPFFVLHMQRMFNIDVNHDNKYDQFAIRLRWNEVLQTSHCVAFPKC